MFHTSRKPGKNQYFSAHLISLARKSHTSTTHNWPNLVNFFSKKEGVHFSTNRPPRLSYWPPLISPISPSTRASLGASFYWVFNQNNIVLMLKCLKYHNRVNTSGTQLENPAKSMNLSVHLYRTKVWCTQRVGSGQFLLQNNQDSHLV